MSNTCNVSLPNLGSKCKYNSAEIHQLIFLSTANDTGQLNKITLADAVTLANWQAKLDIFNFSATPLAKAVVSGRLHLINPDQQDADMIDEGGYQEKLRDGDYNITARFNNPSPYQINELKKMERAAISIYMIDATGRVIGMKDGDDFIPIPLSYFDTTNFNFKSYETQGHADLMMRVAIPTDMNRLWMIELTDGNPNSTNDFYPLINASQTISSPAVTGCVTAIKIDETGEALSGLASGTTDYQKWKFVKSDGTEVSLVGNASVSENAATPGTYTVDEASLLTTGTWSLQISYPPFDILKATVTVT